jgi:hypothetical protein
MSTSRGASKSDLPSKPCLVCGRPMMWRKSWAKNWDQVLYCSEGCRKRKHEVAAATPGAKR